MPSPRLLIVDDDENILEIVEALASDALPSARIAKHSSCLGAFRDIEQQGADLLITDCNMPGMSGPSLVKALRENNFSLPIIMISGCADARKLGEAAGIDRFVPKVRLHTGLAEAIHAVMDAA